MNAEEEEEAANQQAEQPKEASPSPPAPSAPKQKSIPKAIETEQFDEDHKQEANGNNAMPNGVQKIATPTSSGFVITPKKKQNSDILVNGGSLSPTTPIPFNEKLSRNYEERKKQIEDVYDELDESKEGHLNRFKAMKFLKELMNVNMRNAEIVLTGLDSKRTGKFTKEALFNWVYAHSPEMEPNPYLYREAAETFCWLALRKAALETRIQLYSQLLKLEKADKNYSMVFDLEHRICVLTYLLKQC